MQATNATHHLVLEDDLVLCEDFLEGVIEALSWAPHGPVNFYANRAVVERCREQGSSWARIEDGYWGQATCFPSDQVREFLSWDRANLRPDAFAHDSRKTVWGLATGKWVWCTVPSLVDHEGASSSTIGYSNKNRRARWFIGANNSALSVDWSQGVTDPPKDQDKRLSWHGYKDLWQQPPPGIYT